MDMLSASAILVISGTACLLFSGWMMHALRQREGKPPSAWVGTEFRATSIAVLFVTLVAAGVGMLANGIF